MSVSSIPAQGANAAHKPETHHVHHPEGGKSAAATAPAPAPAPAPKPPATAAAGKVDVKA
jgi:hypothetical protein